LDGKGMTADNGLIRQFHFEDAPACSGIMQACMARDPNLPPTAKAEMLRGESAEVMRQRASLIYMAVCVFADCVVGLGGVDLNEIRLLFVAPEHQNRGFGSRLLQHLESWVPPALFSDIFVYAAPGAVKFYRSHGYQPGGECAFAAGRNLVPIVFMTKNIRPVRHFR
jgi:GNAT superfamily N-acetyltransferase